MLDDAIGTWKIVLQDRFGLLHEWCDFLEVLIKRSCWGVGGCLGQRGGVWGRESGVGGSVGGALRRVVKEVKCH